MIAAYPSWCAQRGYACTHDSVMWWAEEAFKSGISFAHVYWCVRLYGNERLLTALCFLNII